MIDCAFRWSKFLSGECDGALSYAFGGGFRGNDINAYYDSQKLLPHVLCISITFDRRVHARSDCLPDCSFPCSMLPPVSSRIHAPHSGSGTGSVNLNRTRRNPSPSPWNISVTHQTFLQITHHLQPQHHKNHEKNGHVSRSQRHCRFRLPLVAVMHASRANKKKLPQSKRQRFTAQNCYAHAHSHAANALFLERRRWMELALGRSARGVCTLALVPSGTCSPAESFACLLACCPRGSRADGRAHERGSSSC